MSNALVTGASGTIGAVLLRDLTQRGNLEVHCQSRSPRRSLWGERWHQFDLEDTQTALNDLPEWDVVFHLAAQTSVKEARHDPLSAVRSNVVGLVALLEALRRQRRPPTVIMSGTVTEAGLSLDLEADNADCDNPVTFYDVTKLSAELLLKQYSREGWIRGCCLRLATVYGAASPTQASDRGIIDAVVRRAEQGERVTIYGSGGFMRDYVHVEDVAAALILAWEHIDALDGNAFSLGTGRGVTVKDAFTLAGYVGAALGGQPLQIEHVAPPADLSPIALRNDVVDPMPFRSLTGWSPRYDLPRGLEKSYGVRPVLRD